MAPNVALAVHLVMVLGLPGYLSRCMMAATRPLTGRELVNVKP